MSDTTMGDMLMYFLETEGGTPLAAESLSSLVGGDARLMSGFVAGKYFDAENFTLSMELADDEGGNIMDESESRSYGRWRGLKESQPKPNPPFRAEPGDVSISRRIDASSPVLLKHCLNTDRFHQAVLVKRTRIGTTGVMSALLRLEFSKVWLKAIEWQDGDAVTENIKFKYASLKASYVRRKPDGSVLSILPCEWTGYQSNAAQR